MPRAATAEVHFAALRPAFVRPPSPSCEENPS